MRKSKRKGTGTRTGPASWSRVAGVIAVEAAEPKRLQGPYSGTSKAALKWSGAISQDGHTPFFLLSLKFYDHGEGRWFNVPPLRGLGPRAAKALIEALNLKLKVPDLAPALDPHKQS